MSLLTEAADTVTHRKRETSPSSPKCPQQLLDALVVYRPDLIPDQKESVRVFSSAFREVRIRIAHSQHSSQCLLLNKHVFPIVKKGRKYPCDDLLGHDDRAALLNFMLGNTRPWELSNTAATRFFPTFILRYPHFLLFKQKKINSLP